MKTITYLGKKYLKIHSEDNTCDGCAFKEEGQCPGWRSQESEKLDCNDESIVLQEIPVEINLPEVAIVAEFSNLVSMMCIVDDEGLLPEVTWSAMKALKNNPNLTILEAYEAGLGEWNIVLIKE